VQFHQPRQELHRIAFALVGAARCDAGPSRLVTSTGRVEPSGSAPITTHVPPADSDAMTPSSAVSPPVVSMA
jgi:hypothetical protein